MRHPKDTGDGSTPAVMPPSTAGDTWSSLASVCLVPIEDIGTRMRVMLRVEPTRNNQSKGIRLAAPYEIARIDVF